MPETEQKRKANMHRVGNVQISDGEIEPAKSSKICKFRENQTCKDRLLHVSAYFPPPFIYLKHGRLVLSSAMI